MTYGTNAPNGFQIKRKLDGSAWTGQLTSYAIASAYNTAIYSGDPVAALADGTIGIGVAGTFIRGIFYGCKYTDTSGNVVNSQYWPASTTVLTGTIPYALVCDDPNVVYSVQETNGSGVAGTPLALADRNLNINFYIQAGNAATGQSKTTIDNSTEANTPTLNCRIIDLDPQPGNVVGAFANWLVTINNSDFKYGTSGV